jgi:hypothetical protein
MVLQFKDQFGGKGPRTLDEQHIALREKAKVAGKALGTTNLPNSTDANVESYIKSVRGSYAGLLSQQQNKIASNAGDVAEIESKASDQKSLRLSERIAEAKTKLRREQLELSEMDDDDGRHVNTFFVWTGVIMIALLEAFFSYKAVGMLDPGNNVVMYLILVCLVAAYISVPKFLRWFFEEFSAGSKYQWLLNLLAVSALGVSFYGLGILRSQYLQLLPSFDVNSTGAAPSLTVSPWLFMSLNLLFLICGYYLNHLLPTSEQSKNRKGLEKRETAIAKLEQEIERCEGELSSVPEREKNSLIRASHSTAGRKDIYIQINNFFKEAIGAFIEANLAYRSDGLRPRCFDASIEDLEDHFA